MEQRPSDSQNESANELPQSVTQPSPSPATDQPASAERAEQAPPSESAPNVTSAVEPVVNEPHTNPSETGGRAPTGQATDNRDPETQSPDGDDLRERLNQPRQRGQAAAGSTESAQPSGQERPRQDRTGNDRQRDGQPRQNQPGNQSPKQGQSGNDRSVNDRQRDGNQPRQPQNQRDPGQPQKQNTPGQERQGQPRTGAEKSGQPTQQRQANGQSSGSEKQRDATQSPKQNLPGTERTGQERQGRSNQPGQERQSRETRSTREVEYEERDEDTRPADFRQPDRNPTGPREETGRESDNRLIIGITLGDYNGIGPEVILKALQNNRLQKICTPVIYGSMRVLNRYRTLLDMKDWNLNGIQEVEQVSHKLTNVITCWPDQNQEIQPGKVTPEAGQAAFACLQQAVGDLRDGKLDAIVTAPINKHNIQSEAFTFPGHTEYLAEAFSVSDNLMFLVSERLRVGVVTGHVPLGKVRQNITRERILQKLTMMSQSLKLDFGIDKPRIAVLGLNPHAGEEGLLGNEEQEILKPLIKQLQDKGNLVYGPFPADGFFGTRAYLRFDAVLAMYHDQGLIPFKAIAFEEGVNFTAAMPVVRTSPDHGTAYDIAGKNIADETSMLQAIYTACDVARRRREHAEIEAGALKPKRERAEKSTGN